MEYRQQERNSLLSLLPRDELERFRRGMRFVQLEPGAVLHQADAPIEQVYFPLDGVVSLHTKFDSGQVVDFAVVGAEGVVGGLAACGVTREPYGARVQGAGSALVAQTAAFLDFLSESDAARATVGKFQATLLLQAQQIAACNAVHGVEARMCRWLLQIRDRMHTNVLPVTQEFLSHMLGVQRTTVTLVEQSLKAAGLVRQRRGRIELLDEFGLRARACECYGHIQRDYRQVLPHAEGDDTGPAGDPSTPRSDAGYASERVLS
jgi:CRP-like cAMP-binding protein